PHALVEGALAAAATILDPASDKDYGGRGGTVLDPDGNQWSVGTYQPSGGGRATDPGRDDRDEEERRMRVIVVGGGHNALVAATYLARAGHDVEVLEAKDHVGGAAVSERPFPGVDVRLSRYSYLVRLLPDALAD